MAGLTSLTIAETYNSLLRTLANGGITASLQVIEDGAGDNTCLQLSTKQFLIKSATDIDQTFEVQNSSGHTLLTVDTISSPEEVVINEGGLTTIDFRVEGSGSANALFVDGSNGKVGIGTSSPDRLFTVMATSNPAISLHRYDVDITDDLMLGEVIFAGSDFGTIGDEKIGAAIQARADTNWSATGDHDQPTKLEFYTQSDVSGSTSLGTPRMTILANGNVGIGSDAPGNDLEISNVGTDPTIELSCFSTSAGDSGTLKFHKSGIADLNTYGAESHTTADETIGRIEAWGTTNDTDGGDGDVEKLGAYIEFANDAISREGTVPSQIIFATASDADDQTPGIRMTVDDSGNIGIGTQDPAVTSGLGMEIYSDGTSGATPATDGAYLRLSRNDTGVGADDVLGMIEFWNNDSGIGAGVRCSIAATAAGTGGQGKLIFKTDENDLAMTIDHGGMVGIGTAPSFPLHVVGDEASSYVAGFHNDGNNVNRNGIKVQAGADDGSTASETTYLLAADGDGGTIGSIGHATDGNFKINATSDARLKENIADTKIVGLDIINAVKVREFNWIPEKKGGLKNIAGFIAQELKEVWSSAVGGDENGDVSTDPMTVAEQSLIPPMLKAIQELSAKVTALENA